ncbi:MAG: PKD domain protein [Verrucomicrobia bacterium ADurb.Bin118]|nr:MAG: PKD domain protein [Verrucomicrobia bacterium ADurb.Bin118]
MTNLVAPVNGRLTNYFTARDLNGDVYHWFPQFGDQASFNNASNSSYNILPNGQLELFLVPASNFTGVIHMYGVVSSSSLWSLLPDFFPYDAQAYRFVFGDTPITAHPVRLTAAPGQSFAQQVVATFTNGVPHSPAANFTATINWGDNVISPGTITSNASGHKEVRGSHTYAHPGEYPVQVTIRSTVGAEAVVTATAVVPPALRLVHGARPPQLAWPSWAAGCQLQTHTQLDAPDWSPVTNQPALMNDDCVVTPDAGSGNGFFRLKR